MGRNQKQAYKKKLKESDKPLSIEEFKERETVKADLKRNKQTDIPEKSTGEVDVLKNQEGQPGGFTKDGKTFLGDFSREEIAEVKGKQQAKAEALQPQVQTQKPLSPEEEVRAALELQAEKTKIKGELLGLEEGLGQEPGVQDSVPGQGGYNPETEFTALPGQPGYQEQALEYARNTPLNERLADAAKAAAIIGGILTATGAIKLIGGAVSSPSVAASTATNVASVAKNAKTISGFGKALIGYATISFVTSPIRNTETLTTENREHMKNIVLDYQDQRMDYETALRRINEKEEALIRIEGQVHLLGHTKVFGLDPLGVVGAEQKLSNFLEEDVPREKLKLLELKKLREFGQ